MGFDRKVHPLVTTVFAEVAQHFGVSQYAMLHGKRRRKIETRARFASAWLLRNLFNLSYPQIGQVMGGRNHTTIISACRRARYVMLADPAFAMVVGAIAGRVRAMIDSGQKEKRAL